MDKTTMIVVRGSRITLQTEKETHDVSVSANNDAVAISPEQNLANAPGIPSRSHRAPCVAVLLGPN